MNSANNKSLLTTQPRILVLGAGALHDGHYQVMRGAGFHTIAMDRNPLAPARSEADVFHCDDPGDVDKVTAAAERFKVDAILPLAEFGVLPAALASERLGLNHINPESAKIARDKALMRQCWERHGIDQPRFHLVTSLMEALTVAADMGFPVVIKPRMLFGARGVRRIDTREELTVFYNDTSSLSQGSVVVEKCIEGIETSVEGIVIDGQATVLAYADKELRAHKYYRVTRSINYPGAFTPLQVNGIRQCAQATVAALGLENSPFHLEVFVVGDRVLPIECGARGGGGHIFSQIVRLVSGIDVVSLAVRILLGDKPTDALSVDCHGACYRFLFPPEGVLVSLPALGLVRQDPGLVSIAFSVAPGAVIEEPENGAIRAGCLVTRGTDRQAAYRAADRVEKLLQWEVRAKN
jgi:biotin carboxylase